MTVNLWGAEITFRVSSAAPDAEPVWVDLSDRVIVPNGQTLETWLGKANELPTGEPGKFRLTLLNNDDALTVGNLTSPYYPWWKQSRRAQVLETVQGKEFVLADVYLEIPQITIAMQPTDGDVKMITVNVSGVDVMSRLRGGRKFQSALAEHVVFQGGSDLKGYWPMTQAAEPFVGYGPTTAALLMTREASGTRAPDAYVQPQAGTAPAGGEASGARMESRPDGPGHAFVRTYLPADFAPAVGASDGITVVFWWNFPASMADNDGTFHQVLIASTPNAVITLERDTLVNGVWTLTAAGSMTGSITGGTVGIEALLPIGVHVRESTNTMELWTGSVRRTTTLTGSGGAGTFNSFAMGYQLDYDLSHLQVYVGTTWGYTQYLEHIVQAHAPLDRQLTGARVNTILDYARFPASRRNIDPGTAVMSQVTLAGKTPGAALEEANITERGRLFAQAGNIQFHDRVRVYNV